MGASEILILALRDAGESLSRAVRSIGLEPRVRTPDGVLDVAFGTFAAVLVDLRAYDDDSSGAQVAADLSAGGHPRVFVLERFRNEELPPEVLRVLQAIAQEGSQGRATSAQGVGSSSEFLPTGDLGGDLGLGIDIARRIDDAVGEAMADLVGAVVDEVIPTLPRDLDPVRLPDLLLDAGANAAAVASAVATSVTMPSEPELRERMLALYALVVEGDYFQLLGVGRDAGADEIRRGYAARRETLSLETLSQSLRTEFGERLDEIETVLSEARAVLQDDELRAAYRANLRD